MYNHRVRRLGMLIVVALVLAGCIQPTSDVDQTRTAVAPYLPLTQAALPAATNPPVVAPTNPPPAAVTTAPGVVPANTPAPAQSQPMVAQFIRDRGETANNLVVWDERPLGNDQVSGFSYTNAAGLPCAGFLLMANINGAWQPNNGSLICAAQPGVEAQAAVTFFLASDGQPYTVVFGRVENPAVSAVAVVFSDNASQMVNPVMGGFLLIQGGVVSATVITGVDAQGNTVIPNIPQSPV